MKENMKESLNIFKEGIDGWDNRTGVCPLCEKESEQYLRWVVKDVNNDDEF